ncbi:DUF4270 domain-containing protein [Chryseobacterium sp. JUb7]|uniref:DUF4270 domain-containing protein n=1 Tax=Chryseobacterium sp. JUb7 TaxID=2940599 RepID=UPI00216A0D04|nr:DUF4270 domain-containing protein [Chryseobacterium sp. JUb7]MCS3529916.1 hypothetical protein [Chryseobacterium sp. JUb7]
MTYTIKRTFAILFLAIFGSALLYNCEPDPDTLGEQLHLDDAAQGNEKSFSVIAFNIDNHDSIRSDASKLTSAVLGAFKEGQFGMQRASYLTQLRLSTYNPDFGTNAQVDSVVLVIKPTYASDSLTTTTDENYVYPDGNVDAKKVVNTYPVNKYGRAKKQMTLQVHEVLDFLNSPSDSVKSNKTYAVNPTPLASKVFDGKVNTVTITKDSDASSLFATTTPAIRLQLTPSVFQSKIIAMKGKPELQDASNFIRHFRGLRISVLEDDGYLMQISPNDMELIMYYKSDKTENGTTTRPQTTYTFALGSANAHIGQYEYDRTGSAVASASIGNKVTGDEKLYTQGMGGNSIGIKIPSTTVDSLKNLYQNNKAAIISAKVRIYTDKNDWNKNTYAKPTAFTIIQKDKVDGVTKSTFTTDLTEIAGSNNFAIYRAFKLDEEQAYYEFTVTKSVKDLVEAGKSNADKYFKIDLGSFLTTTTGTLAGFQYTSRAYIRDRAVFIGNDGTNKKVSLRVIYGTK